MDAGLASKVLFIGVDYHNPRGGIASVENEYAKFISPFKFLPSTVAEGSNLSKLLKTSAGLMKMCWLMLADRRIRIVHIHSASNASFRRKCLFMNLAHVFGKKVIIHNHGGGFKEFYRSNKAMADKAFRKVDCVIALTDDWRDFFTDEVNFPKVEVVPNVVQRPVTGTQPTHDHAEVLHLTFLGKIVKEKGIYDLVKLLADRRRKYMGKVHLTIGGNGETDRLCQLIHDEKLEEMVDYAGWVDGKRKSEILQDTDVYILPSYFEGLPISILEAMSYAKPVISTRVGGIPSIVRDGHNGLLIQAGNMSELESALDKVVDNKMLVQSMGNAALADVQAYFPEAIDRKLTDLYVSLLD